MFTHIDRPRNSNEELNLTLPTLFLIVVASTTIKADTAFSSLVCFPKMEHNLSYVDFSWNKTDAVKWK